MREIWTPEGEVEASRRVLQRARLLPVWVAMLAVLISCTEGDIGSRVETPVEFGACDSDIGIRANDLGADDVNSSDVLELMQTYGGRKLTDPSHIHDVTCLFAPGARLVSSERESDLARSWSDWIRSSGQVILSQPSEILVTARREGELTVFPIERTGGYWPPQLTFEVVDGYWQITTMTILPGCDEMPLEVLEPIPESPCE